MTKNRLKQLRIIIPGIIVLIYLVLIFQFTISKHLHIPESITNNSNIVYLIYFICTVIIGGPYHILNVRNILWNNYLPLIQFNIRNRLLAISKNNLDLRSLDKLREWRDYRDIFYHFVDKDKSLEDRANSVRLNGLIWTTIMDLAIISLIFSMGLFCLSLITDDLEIVLQGYFILAIGIAMLILIGPITKSHIQASDKQLDYMNVHFKKEIKQKMNELLQ